MLKGGGKSVCAFTNHRQSRFCHKCSPQGVFHHLFRGTEEAMHRPSMTIEIPKDVVPCKHFKPCSIPCRWKVAVLKQLTSMQNGVIEKVRVGESYRCCRPTVVVPKKDSNKPYITVDLSSLNINHPAYPTKLRCEIIASVPPGIRYFATLDARHGCWQIPVDEESSRLTTFMMPWSAFRFK